MAEDKAWVSTGGPHEALQMMIRQSYQYSWNREVLFEALHHKTKQWIVLRYGMHVMSLLGCVAGLIFTGLRRGHASAAVTLVCAECTRWNTFGLVMYTGYLAIFAVALVALVTRRPRLRPAYATSRVLCIAFGVLCYAMYVLVFPANDFAAAWVDAIAHDEARALPGPAGGYTSALCRLETEFQCSGWRQLCNATEPYTAHNTRSKSCPICTDDDQQVIAASSGTCAVAVDRMIQYTVIFQVLFHATCLVEVLFYATEMSSERIYIRATDRLATDHLLHEDTNEVELCDGAAASPSSATDTTAIGSREQLHDAKGPNYLSVSARATSS